MWFINLANHISGPQVINDSKTPSGPVHVGSLRGVLIHDAVARELRHRGIEARFRYGIDDYDALDSLPAGLPDSWSNHLGKPLCEVPPPPGSAAGNYGQHYSQDYLEIVGELGVEFEPYRTSELYRQGVLNTEIRDFLDNAAEVCRIYLEVAGSARPADWLPLHPICESCGRIGTTQAIDWDGSTVSYRCQPNLVSWARGCGFEGRVSPFDGRAKLPWKLEWPARWRALGVTIEGAGKDHCTKGGSRPVGARLARNILKFPEPRNIPYEFFLVAGSKMSSSKGIGHSARSIFELLPTDLLRYLCLRTPPKSTLNFSTEAEFIYRLFDDYDRLAQRVMEGSADTGEQALWRVVSTEEKRKPCRGASFRLLTTLLQFPHIDATTEVSRRFDKPLNPAERQALVERVARAQRWLDNYIPAESRFELQTGAPAELKQLGETQILFLRLLRELIIEQEPENEDRMQTLVFDAAKLTPLAPKQAFSALYTAFLAREQGPRAGSLLSFLERDFVLRRLGEVPALKTGEQKLSVWSSPKGRQVQLWLNRAEGGQRLSLSSAEGSPFWLAPATDIDLSPMEVSLQDTQNLTELISLLRPRAPAA